MIHVRRINDRLHLYLSFQWVELRGPPSPGTRGRGMKTSAESLLITISNAQRGRQTRESERIKGERGEGGRKRVGFRVQRHGSQN